MSRVLFMHIETCGSFQIMKGIMMPGWNLTAFEVLEKLSHVYHMSEIWVQAGEKYKEVKTCYSKL